MKPSPLASRTALRLLWLFALLSAGLRADEQLYTCGMHPQVIRKEPGNCPICGMALTPIRRNGPSERPVTYYQSSMNPGEVSPKPGKDSMGMDLIAVYGEPAAGPQAIRIDGATVQRMNLRTALVQSGPVVREFRTVGVVAFDERGLRDVTLKYDGWIESVSSATTGATVKAGEVLIEVYSPELYNAELNLVGARRAEGEAGGPLTRAARARLELFNLPAEAIDAIARSGVAPRTRAIAAPSGGVVVERGVVAGQMVRAGDRLFRLADLSTVWVEAQIVEQDLAFVSPGQKATVRVTYGPERSVIGSVDLILPQVQEETRAAIARIVLANPDGSLKPGMFVDVRLAAELASSSVLVPDLAVLRSGEHTTVFIDRGNGAYEPRAIRLGARSQGDLYQVLGGLKEGERVVTSGQFMLDSESQLRDAIQKMLTSSAGPAQAPAAAQPRGPMAGMESALQLPDSARRPLVELALSTALGAEALGRDDLGGYRAALGPMRERLSGFLGGYGRAAQGPLGAFQGGLKTPPDIASARLEFARFSTAVADLLRDNHLLHDTGLHLFQCPMAPGIGTGRWLSASPVLRNPFYGAAMPGCGDELDAAPAVPAGAKN